MLGSFVWGRDSTVSPAQGQGERNGLRKQSIHLLSPECAGRRRTLAEPGRRRDEIS